MEVMIPGGEKSWVEILPDPLNEDPEVVVVLAPDDALYRVRQTTDGKVTIGVLECPDNRVIGLQVLHPQEGDWAFQYRTLNQLGIRMASPVYVGPLSSCPNRVFCTDGMCPLVFLRNGMHRQYFNVKRFANWMKQTRESEGEKLCN